MAPLNLTPLGRFSSLNVRRSRGITHLDYGSFAAIEFHLSFFYEPNRLHAIAREPAAAVTAVLDQNRFDELGFFSDSHDLKPLPNKFPH